MTSLDLHVGPLGRVEGDLDVRVTIDDGVVTSAWTEAAMFRGFEIILRGGTHRPASSYVPVFAASVAEATCAKSAYALDTAWRTTMPANATPGAHIAQACETLQSIPRYFYALFAIDLTNKNYAKSSLYDEAVRRFAPYVGTSYQRCGALNKARRGLRDLRRPVAALQFHGARWGHGRAVAVRRDPFDGDPGALEGQLARGRVVGVQRGSLAGEQDLEDVLAWVDENESQYNSDCGFFIRYCLDIGLDKYGQGVGNYISTGTYFDPALYQRPTIEGATPP